MFKPKSKQRGEAVALVIAWLAFAAIGAAALAKSAPADNSCPQDDFGRPICVMIP